MMEAIPLKKLSASQERILNYLKERAQDGLPPSVREICRATGLKSTSTVHVHLKTLEENGYITRDAGLNRAIHITGEERSSQVPVLGKVTAGLPILAVEDIEDRLKTKRKITHPRPGHADLVGGMKYRFDDLRNSLERSSARETTMRVAVGAVAKRILAELDIEIANHVVVFGGKEIDVPENLTVAQIKELAQQSEISVVNQEREQEIKDYIDQIKKEGDTIGGVVETVVGGVPVGLGSYVQWDTKLDAKIAQAVVSINAFKGVEFGLGFKDGYLKGSQVMDEILWNEEDGYTRRTNNLGGFEGGMTNGQPIVVRGVMKPIPTLYKPLMSVDIETHEPYKATVERSDPTALPAAGVVMESVVATVVANEILDKFSSDNMEELKEAVARHRDYVKNF